MADFREYTRILDGEHVIEEANGWISREQIMLKASAAVIPGLVLGLIDRGAQSVNAAAVAGNTGNGVFGAAPTADANAAPGTYRVTVIGAAANGGVLQVEDPTGVVIGNPDVGAAFDGPVNFTLNDGATDFAVGDAFSIVVGYAAANMWAALNLAANDGSQNAAGVLFAGRRASLANDRRAVAHVRDCVINGKKIKWPAGITNDQRKAQEALLARTTCLIRY